MEVAAEVVEIDILCCSYPLDLQKLDGYRHGEIEFLLLSAGREKTLAQFWAPQESQPMV